MFNLKEKSSTLDTDVVIDINKGLSESEAKKRFDDGKYNKNLDVKTKSVKEIFKTNVFTLFNMVNFFLAILVILTGSFKNALFMGTILCNMSIGIYQELRHKKAVDRLCFLNSTDIRIIRDYKIILAKVEEIVIDDIIILSNGNQVPSDCVVVEGDCEVNESMITGESVSISKSKNDKLTSGSFIVSGTVKAQVVNVGEDNYINKITKDLKKIKKESSKILIDVKKIIKATSIILFPIGTLLFLKQFLVLGSSFNDSIISMVTVVIGIMPEGLILLISMVMAISIIRLSRSKVLVQQLYSIENLSRVNVLCLDKTGTITTGNMCVSQVVMFNQKEDCKEELSSFINGSDDDNSTFKALKAYVEGVDIVREVQSKIAFSSSRKYSAVKFTDGITYIMGAADFVLKGAQKSNVSDMSASFLNEGKRVLIFASTSEDIQDHVIPETLNLISLIVIDDEVRSDAGETLSYFYEQGVDVKIISGDNPVSVSNIAKRIGLKGYENYVDASLLSDHEIRKCVYSTNIFGRVSPFQKLEIIKELKRLGNTVAMTGDGVNDTLALKEADCSIAMASGSEAARNVSEIVLLESNFSTMPKIVAEGRRAVNNIQRSSSLYISRTIYSVLLGVLFLLLDFKYPFIPIQMTLINAISIGIPSFFLALEPNRDLIKGSFLKNILEKSFPGGISVLLNIYFVILFGDILGFSEIYITTMCLVVTACTTLCILYQISKPFSIKRLVLFIFVSSVFVIAILFFNDFFSISQIDIQFIISCILISAFPTMLFRKLGGIVFNIFANRKKFIV